MPDAEIEQASPFSPNIAATPDGKQVWFTLKDIGKTQVFRAESPFDMVAITLAGSAIATWSDLRERLER